MMPHDVGYSTNERWDMVSTCIPVDTINHIKVFFVGTNPALVLCIVRIILNLKTDVTILVKTLIVLLTFHSIQTLQQPQLSLGFFEGRTFRKDSTRQWIFNHPT